MKKRPGELSRPKRICGLIAVLEREAKEYGVARGALGIVQYPLDERIGLVVTVLTEPLQGLDKLLVFRI